MGTTDLSTNGTNDSRDPMLLYQKPLRVATISGVYKRKKFSRQLHSETQPVTVRYRFIAVICLPDSPDSKDTS